MPKHKLIIGRDEAHTNCGLRIVAFYPEGETAICYPRTDVAIKCTVFDDEVTCDTCIARWVHIDVEARALIGSSLQ